MYKPKDDKNLNKNRCENLKTNFCHIAKNNFRLLT